MGFYATLYIAVLAGIALVYCFRYCIERRNPTAPTTQAFIVVDGEKEELAVAEVVLFEGATESTRPATPPTP